MEVSRDVSVKGHAQIFLDLASNDGQRRLIYKHPLKFPVDTNHVIHGSM